MKSALGTIPRVCHLYRIAREHNNDPILNNTFSYNFKKESFCPSAVGVITHFARKVTESKDAQHRASTSFDDYCLLRKQGGENNHGKDASRSGMQYGS
jgi:hypothetical protein